MLVALAAGFALAFVGSVPIAGPVSALVLSRAIDQRHKEAIAIAVGAAFGEAIYAFLAFFGVGMLFARFPWVGSASRSVAGAALAFVGLMLIRMKPAASQSVGQRVHARHLVLGFGMTALNPTLISTWSAAAAIVYASGLGPFTRLDAGPFAFGVVAGVASWFTCLVWIVDHGKRSLTRPLLQSIVRVTGGALVVLGLAFLLRELWLVS